MSGCGAGIATAGVLVTTGRLYSARLASTMRVGPSTGIANAMAALGWATAMGSGGTSASGAAGCASDGGGESFVSSTCNCCTTNFSVGRGGFGRAYGIAMRSPPTDGHRSHNTDVKTAALLTSPGVFAL